MSVDRSGDALVWGEESRYKDNIVLFGVVFFIYVSSWPCEKRRYTVRSH